jgi:flagellin
VGEYGGGENGQALSKIDISTVEGANKAIVAIDNALERVNNVRSDLGAVNNRLDFTINNLTSISQNASASRSRIEDADFALETSKLSRSQVLMQASQAMLAQANSQPQQVLSLLR